MELKEQFFNYIIHKLQATSSFSAEGALTTPKAFNLERKQNLNVQ